MMWGQRGRRHQALGRSLEAPVNLPLGTHAAMRAAARCAMATTREVPLLRCWGCAAQARAAHSRQAGRQAGWLAGWQAGWLAGWQAGRQHKARAASAGVGPPAKLWKLMAVVCAVI
jgi:hypothetical protein